MEFFPVFAGVQWQAGLAGGWGGGGSQSIGFKMYNKQQRKKENAPKWTQRDFQPLPEEEEK